MKSLMQAISLALILTAAATVNAQSKPCVTDADGHSYNCSFVRRHQFKLAVAAYAAAAIYDGVRSTQKINTGRYRELNPLLRSGNNLSIPKFVAFNAVAVGMNYYLKRNHHSTAAKVMLWLGAGAHMAGAR